MLDQASLPTVKSGPHRTVTVLMAVMVAFVLTVVGIFGFDLAGQLLKSGQSDSSDSLKREVAEAFPRTNRLVGVVRNRLKREPISVDSAG